MGTQFLLYKSPLNSPWRENLKRETESFIYINMCLSPGMSCWLRCRSFRACSGSRTFFISCGRPWAPTSSCVTLELDLTWPDPPFSFLCLVRSDRSPSWYLILYSLPSLHSLGISFVTLYENRHFSLRTLRSGVLLKQKVIFIER